MNIKTQKCLKSSSKIISNCCWDDTIMAFDVDPEFCIKCINNEGADHIFSGCR